MTIQTIYKTPDGRTFKTHADAVEYEEARAAKAEKLYKQYMTGYQAGQLLKEYKLSDTGIWGIYGEDDNPDFAGPHVTPHLEDVSGTLEQAIRYAVSLNAFYTWGAGGHIKKQTKKVRVL